MKKTNKKSAFTTVASESFYDRFGNKVEMLARFNSNDLGREEAIVWARCGGDCVLFPIALNLYSLAVSQLLARNTIPDCSTVESARGLLNIAKGVDGIISLSFEEIQLWTGAVDEQKKPLPVDDDWRERIIAASSVFGTFRFAVNFPEGSHPAFSDGAVFSCLSVGDKGIEVEFSKNAIAHLFLPGKRYRGTTSLGEVACAIDRKD